MSCSVSQQQWCLSLSSVLMLCNLLLAWLMVQQQIFQGRINYKLPIPFTKWVKMEPIGRRRGTLFSCKSYLGFQGFPISKLNIFCVFQVFQLVQSWREFYFWREEEAVKLKYSMLSTGWQEEQYLMALYVNKWFLIAVLFWIDYDYQCFSWDIDTILLIVSVIFHV